MITALLVLAAVVIAVLAAGLLVQARTVRVLTGKYQMTRALLTANLTAAPLCRHDAAAWDALIALASPDTDESQT